MTQSENDDNSVGANIKKARALLNLSQEQLAAKLQTGGCDISRGTLAKIEVGIRQIKVSELSAISGVLGVSYEFLIDGPDARLAR